jgi:ribose transport system ATP-binding protein
VRGFNVRENTTLPSLRQLSPRGALRAKLERAFSLDWLSRVSVSTSVLEREIETLSGGNQQKVLMSRWLATKPRVLVMSEPTAGVDVGARSAIYQAIREQAASGLGVIVASTDAEDLLALCNRVIVLRDGVVARELSGSAIGKASIIAAMEGSDG